jgi:pilus retraction protein PilT
MERVAPNTSLGKLLAWCAQKQATDIHAQANRRYAYRVDGKLLRIDPQQFPTPPNEEIIKLLSESFSRPTVELIENHHECDLSFICENVRYRANFSKQQGAQSFSFRVVTQKIPQLDDLELPASVADLVQEPRGLVLITGAAGQGKSTSTCALLQRLNETTPLRIITIEDPIEYVFEEKLCQFEQREVAVDTESFVAGIRNAMRQDPEVIFIGEIRDRDSIQAAMQAAETGHLVLATLHADSVIQAIDRIREFHSSTEQASASALLARSLNAITCQRLLPSTFNKRVPCLEIMRRNAGTQQAIARNDLHLLAGHIEASLNEGMHSFDQYLMQLLKGGFVTEETARHYAVNWSRVDMEIHGFAPEAPGLLKPDPDR